jgi:CubicO group peptidase (beta-lactamase class C family)
LISVEHLLGHTSGLASAWDHPSYDFNKTYTDEEFKKLAEEVSLAFQVPGEKHYYSNIGYTLLGKIVERIDRMPFERSLEKNIFLPAGMSMIKSLEQAEQIAIPYYQVSPRKFVQDNQQTLKKFKPGDGAGGWIINAAQLTAFLSAYKGDLLLTSKARQTHITANGRYFGFEKDYRFELRLLPAKFSIPRPIYGHNGGGKGFTVDGYLDLDSGYCVAMFSNQNGSAYSLTANIFRVLHREQVIPPVHSPVLRLVQHVLEYTKPSDVFRC